MMNLKRISTLCAFALLGLPFTASAKVTCETLQAMIDVPDDQCEAISNSAQRCFTALNFEYAQVRKTKDKELRSRTAGELVSDYTREINNWRRHYVYISRLGEGRACIDQTAEVEAWIEELEKDLKTLAARRY